MRDELMEKLHAAIDEFSEYQTELSSALDTEPVAVIKMLGQWNNRHQKMAASLQFFVDAFIEELGRGTYTPETGQKIAQAIGHLHEKESALFNKLTDIRRKMVEEKNKIKEGQKALVHYSVQARRHHASVYLSKDA